MVLVSEEENPRYKFQLEPHERDPEYFNMGRVRPGEKKYCFFCGKRVWDDHRHRVIVELDHFPYKEVKFVCLSCRHERIIEEW